MKNLKNAGLVLLIIVALQACNMGTYKTAKMKNKADSASYMIGVSIGQNLKAQDVPDIDPALIAKGIDAVLNNDSTPSQMAINQFLDSYFRDIMEKKSAKAKEEGDAFLEANKSKPGVQVTASGLQFRVITEGTGKSPAGNDRVKVQYKGTLANGEQFDSSYDKGQPIEFSLHGTIPGFAEGLQMMKEGGKYELVIPPELAYGPQGASKKIGPNAVLVFEVELLEVLPGDDKGEN